jgi:hypothetical protein
MKTIHPEMIKILSVKTLKSSVSATEDYVNNQVKPAGVEINVGLKTACSIAAKNIRVRLSIELNSTNGEEETVGVNGEFVIEFTIHVDNLDEFIIKQDGKQIIDKKLEVTINGIVYSTARGIVYEKTIATPFGGVLLPVIDPDLLIENKSTN